MVRAVPVAIAAAMAVALIGTAVAQSTSQTAMPSGRVERTVSTSATVEAIDMDKRTVLLRRADGTKVSVQVDRSVKNLPQVRVGDHVRVNYREAIAFQVRPAGEIAPGASMNEGVTTAKPGEKPAASETRQITIVATIDAINPDKQSVRLRTADGDVTDVRVRDPNNLKKVKVGDQVEVTYNSALALAVVEAPAAAGSSTPASRRGMTTKELNRQELERIQAGQ